MTALLEDASPAELVKRGEVFLRLLGRSPRSHVVASAFEPAQRALTDAVHARERAAAEVAMALEARDSADERLDTTVAELSLAALELAKGDARDPLFAGLFPEGPQAVTCAPVDEEIGLVHRLLDRLERHPLRARFHQRLAAELAQVELADGALSESLQFEQKAYGAFRKAEVAWRLQGRLAEGAWERLRDAGAAAELAGRVLVATPRKSPPSSATDAAARGRDAKAKAAGAARPKQAAGARRPKKAAGAARPKQAAGAARPKQAAGAQRPKQAGKAAGPQVKATKARPSNRPGSTKAAGTGAKPAKAARSGARAPKAARSGARAPKAARSGARSRSAAPRGRR